MKYKTNMKKEKKNYESPQLTVVEFRVERGFAESTLVKNASDAVNAFVNTEMTIRIAQQDASGNVIAGNMTGNEDHSDAGSGSAWQYADGGWF